MTRPAGTPTPPSWSIALVVLLTAACLLPFAGKALHIDDPLFLWTGQQIRSDPLDFYGFTVNWYGRDEPASDVIKNPPGGGYFIAIVSALFGTGEVPLHLAFLLPAIGTILGTFFVARRLGADSVVAALVALSNPVFLISATQIMCDVTMLCFWVWALYFWLRGIHDGRSANFLLAAVLVTACTLTKYFGMCLIPLLLVHGLAVRRASRRCIAYLAIPLFVLAVYQWYTASTYGRGLLLDASSYAENARLLTGRTYVDKALTGLVFTGGCLSSVLFFAPRIWSRRVLLTAAGVVVLAVLLLPLAGSVGQLVLRDDAGTRWGDGLQLGLFGVVGVAWLALAAADWRERRNADSALLVLWLLGTFVFATFVNWTVNGRSVLPMVPAAGLLVARRMEAAAHALDLKRLAVPLIPAMILAILPTWADYRLARSARTVAEEIVADQAASPGEVWFLGHWGFQYYMERNGARPIDMSGLELEPDDTLVTPSNNTNLFELPPHALREASTISHVPSRWISTMSYGRSGFYSDVWGPMPYAFGSSKPETYRIQRVRVPLRTSE